MWQKFCIALCTVLCAACIAAPCALAEDTSADSSASSSETSDSSFLGDAGRLNDSVSDNWGENVDKVSDSLSDVHGALHYNVKDDFPKFIKDSLTWVPVPFWWAFELSILFGFITAIYNRLT